VSENSWSHHNPVKIIAGAGYLNKLPDLVPQAGSVLFLSSPGFTRRGVTKKAAALLDPDRVHVYDQLRPNPELEDLDRLVVFCRDLDVSHIVALGGGSVLDAAKVLGVALPSGMHNPLDLIFRQKQAQAWNSRLPVTAIPTTAGTGAEVTPFATVWDRVSQKKYSVSGGYVYPACALLDPELTLDLPFTETLYTGLDAISHALESLWNKNRTEVSAACALHSLDLAVRALPAVLEHPESLDCRSRMQTAALLAGLAISQTRTAIAHSISYPLSIRFGLPHGLACGFTLPALIRRYLPSLEQGREKITLKSVLDILDALQLQSEAAGYMSQKDLLLLLADMYDPDRADNYRMDLGRDDLREILQASLTR